MRLLLSLLLFLSLLVPSMPALAAEQQVWIQRIGGEESGEVLGSVMARDTSDGLVISPSISGLACLLYTSPSPRDLSTSRMPSSA